VRAGHEPRPRPDRVRNLGERHELHLEPAPLAPGGERTEQARVLLVAGEHLVAGAELERGEHRVHAVGRRVGEGELLGVAAEQPGDLPAQALADRHELLEVARPAAALVALPIDLRRRRCSGRRRHRSLGPGVQVRDPLEDRELSA
jgi:hypothetical protein